MINFLKQFFVHNSASSKTKSRKSNDGFKRFVEDFANYCDPKTII